MYMHSDNVLLVLLLYVSHICISIRMRLPSTAALSRWLIAQAQLYRAYLLGHVTAARQDWPVSLRNDVL